MTQQEQMPWRFGTHASVIQLLALLITGGTFADADKTLNACTLASLLFWTCSISILLWHRPRPSRMDLLFFHWGLLAFVLIGTPLLRPVVGWWAWLPLVLNPSIALLLVMSLLHLVVRVFGLGSPFDGIGLGSPFDGTPPPPGE
jgi:hypothetical protein